MCVHQSCHIQEQFDVLQVIILQTTRCNLHEINFIYFMKYFKEQHTLLHYKLFIFIDFVLIWRLPQNVYQNICNYRSFSKTVLTATSSTLIITKVAVITITCVYHPKNYSVFNKSTWQAVYLLRTVSYSTNYVTNIGLFLSTSSLYQEIGIRTSPENSSTLLLQVQCLES